jgi:hypothetical protein
MLACCARKVPLRGAGGVGDSVWASRVGHGGFGAFGARCMPSRIVARSACSVSLPTLAPLSLSAHPPVSTTPVTRFFFRHSVCFPPQICVVNCFPLSAFLQSVLHPLPPAVSSSPGLSSISHLSHDPFSRPATHWFRPRAVACEKAAAAKFRFFSNLGDWFACLRQFAGLGFKPRRVALLE